MTVRRVFLGSLLLLVPLLAGPAWAQSGDIRLAVEPGYFVARPGTTVHVNLSVHNPTARDISLEIAAKPQNATTIKVLLSPTQVKVSGGSAVRVAVAVQLPRDLPAGAQPIVFGARETAATSPSGGAGGTSNTTFDLRIEAAATPEPTRPAAAAPTPSPAAPVARASPAPLLAPSPATPEPSPARVEAAAQVAPAPGGGVPTTMVVLGAATAAGGVSVAALAMRRRWGALGLLAPLYTRLTRSKMLDQPTRQRVADLVTAEPGITFGDAQRRLDLGAGTLTHHARMLEEAGVIFSSPDGQTRRLFPVGGGRVVPVPPLAERAMTELSNGPVTLSELAARLRVSKQALHYHVKRLTSEGAVVARRQGGELVLEKAPSGAKAHASA